MWLDSELNWRKQASSLTGKVFRALRTLAFLRRSLDRQTRILVVRALCMTHLDYCAAVYSNLDVRTSTICQVALNACVRFICDVPRRSSVSVYRLKLGFLTASNRRLYFSLIILYKLIYNRFPPLLLDTVSLKPHTMNRVGRSAKSLKFIVPRCNLASYTKSFSFGVVRVWNDLPDRIRHSSNLSGFKRALFAYLISKEKDPAEVDDLIL